MITPQSVRNKVLYLSDGATVNADALRALSGDLANVYPMGLDSFGNVVMSSGRVIPRSVVVDKVAEHYTNEAARKGEHVQTYQKQHSAAEAYNSAPYNRRYAHLWSVTPPQALPTTSQAQQPASEPVATMMPPAAPNGAPPGTPVVVTTSVPSAALAPTTLAVPPQAEGYKLHKGPRRDESKKYTYVTPRYGVSPMSSDVKRRGERYSNTNNPTMSSVEVKSYGYDSHPSPFFAADNERYFPVNAAYSALY